MHTSDWEFPLQVDDQVRVTHPNVKTYYGRDGIIADIHKDTPTSAGPRIAYTVVFEDGSKNVIARHALTFVAARALSVI